MEQFNLSVCGSVCVIPAHTLNRIQSGTKGPMEIKKMERLLILCQLASAEHDSEKLVELVEEINNMIEAKTPIAN
jgi:hypothetical protein